MFLRQAASLSRSSLLSSNSPLSSSLSSSLSSPLSSPLSSFLFPSSPLSSSSLLSRYSTLKQWPRFVAIRFNIGDDSHTQIEGNFQYTWLRDHDPNSIDPSSGQKLHSSADVMETGAATPVKVELVEGEKKLRVEWKDQKVSIYEMGWLRDHVYPGGFARRFPAAARPKLWENKDLPDLNVSYEDYMNPNDKGLKRLLELMHDYGVAFVKGAPLIDDEVGRVAERFGLIRETLYGRLWDVKSVPRAQNIAYTSLPLHYHQDLLYFESPPGIQLLHSLKNSVTGGDTLFMDGFKAAEILKRNHPEAFAILTKVPVTFHYKNGENHRHYRHPTIVLDSENEYSSIYYSPQFQGPLDMPMELVDKFYESYALFSKIVNDPALTLRTRLMPGDVVVFNNRRLLHARTVFDPNSGERHLKGTYADLDDFRSKWRLLRAKQL